MTEIKVNTGDSLQNAINNALPGDVIAVEAGATFRGPIELPNKVGSTEIVIQSSRVSELPQERVNPSHSVLMPKILCPAFEQAIRTKPGAHHYKLDGIEVQPDPAVVSDTSVTRIYDLVRLGGGRDPQTTLDTVPHHIKVDRCYIHGLSGTHFQRGISLNSMDTEITRCYISEIHAKGMDAQAICSWNTPGRLVIEDCYLEASGENFLLGGSDPASEAFLPSDVRLLRSHLFKPLEWKTSKAWTVKNLLEVKAGKNLLFDGNVLENNWVDGQAGIAVLFTVRNQEGSAPYSVILNLTFSNNTLKNSEGGALNFLGSDNEKPSQRCSGAVLRNNLFTDIGSNFLTINGYNDVTFDRNTHLQKGNLTTFYGTPSTGFKYTNNLTVDHDYGIWTEAGIGNVGLAQFAPAAVWTNNVIANPYDKGSYPAGNQYPVTWTPPADFRSLFPGIGCDIDALSAAQQGTAPTPEPVPTPTPTPDPTPVPSPTPAPAPCKLSLSVEQITLPSWGSTTIAVTLENMTGPTEVKAIASSGQVTVTPGLKTVSGTSAVIQFQVGVKKKGGTITFSSPCGSKSLAVNVR